MKPLRIAGLVSLMLGLGTSGLVAQKPASRVGVLGGVNFATLKGDDVESPETYTRFFGGGFAELVLSRNFAIAPEVLYTMKGAKETEQGTEAKLKIGYIEVPVLLKVMFPSSNEGTWAVRPHLYAGPAFAFKTSCKVAGEEGGVAVEFDCDEFAEAGEIRSTDFSAIAGAGVDIGNLMLGVRYDFGLTKLSKLPDGTSEDVKNRVFSIYAGFGFRVK